jgi:hypothetical protein
MSIYATKTGLWSDPTVWNTGVLPISTDVVRPNNFIVTMDVNATVAEIRHDAGGGAVAGGRFILNGGLTVTSNLFASVTTVPLITFSSIVNSSIVGVITGNGTVDNVAIINSGLGTLNIQGNVNLIRANTASNLTGLIINQIAGIINITGTINGSSDINSFNTNQCLVNLSTGTINIVGNVNSPTVAGGLLFTISNNSTGTITIQGNVNTTASTAIVNRSSGTVTIGGNITVNGGTAITNASGTVTINGNCASNDGTILTNTSGIITITGDIAQNSSTGSSRIAINNTGIGTISIVGNLTASNSALNNNFIAISNSGSGIINVTGIISAGTGSASNSVSRIIDNTSNGIVNITGTINGTSSSVSTSGVNAVRNAGSGTINFTGNVNGNSNSLAVNSALFNLALGIINISGNAIGGSTGLAVGNAGTGTINLNGNAIGGTSYAAVENSNSSGTLIVEKIVFGANGQTATRGYIKFKNISTMAAETVLKTDATTTNLVDINVVPNLQPSISDVRLGVTYSSGSLTGTMNVPPFNAVKAGVPVDNGVGTAYLDAADLWNYMISGITQSGSIGERLKIVSTIETTGTQLASFNV